MSRGDYVIHLSSLNDSDNKALFVRSEHNIGMMQKCVFVFLCA